MARINIEDCWWTDPRRSALQRLGMDADGLAVRAWRLAQDFWKNGRALVPKALFDTLDGAGSLLDVGLAEVRESLVYVRGSSAYLDWIHERRLQAKEAGKKSAKRPRDAKGRLLKANTRHISNYDPTDVQRESNAIQPSYSLSSSSSFSESKSNSEEKNLSGGLSKTETTPPQAKKPARETNPDGPTHTALCWRAYRDAFEARYHAAPPWNAKTGGLLKHLIARVPAADAPDLAAFYLTHNDQLYVRAKHPADLLLRDAEKLYTEWKTGNKSTATAARQLDQRQANFDVWAPIIAQAEAEEREKGRGDG